MVLEKRSRSEGGSSRTIILFIILIICSTISYTYVTNLTTKQSLLPDFDFDAPSSTTQQQQQPYDEADYIIQKSYSETYARMYNCPDDVIEKQCILQIVEKQTEQLQQNQNTTNINTNAKYKVPIDHPYPWWFQSLLRDIPTNGAYGFWHHFSTIATKSQQPIKYCAIGKNGSTEWRKIFKELNAPEFCNEDDIDRYKCSKFNTATKLGDDVAKTVFIRDPLERCKLGFLYVVSLFLSLFISDTITYKLICFFSSHSIISISRQMRETKCKNITRSL